MMIDSLPAAEWFHFPLSINNSLSQFSSFKNVSEFPHSISIFFSFLRFCSSLMLYLLRSSQGVGGLKHARPHDTMRYDTIPLLIIPVRLISCQLSSMSFDLTSSTDGDEMKQIRQIVYLPLHLTVSISLSLSLDVISSSLSASREY